MNVGFVSLGCSKNLVDTEMMIGIFKENKYLVVSNPKDADIIVINTCGFIQSAKEEAINTILEMSEYKKKKCKYLIVTGCLVERYKNELIKDIPEVDLFIKFSEYESFWKQIDELVNKNSINNQELNYNNRVISTGNNYAYLRVADGCDNFCTFCAIPYIRGRYKSRRIEDILEEAKQLVSKGIKELIIIAQDTTKYGSDIYGEPKLHELLHKLSMIDGVEWIRFLYSYPETITDELIEEVKTNEKICKYFDIPIQHISDNILKKMNRKTNKKGIEELIIKLRKEIPDVVIRSTVMVGFPGETKADYEELYTFIEKAKLDKLGCFMYSKEENTPAEKMPYQVHYSTKKSRYNKIMELQQKISKENLKSKIGKTLKVIIEQNNIVIDGKKYSIGRSYMDVPDIDGIVYISGNANKNEFINCKVTDYKEYDLIGKII